MTAITFIVLVPAMALGIFFLVAAPFAYIWEKTHDE